LLQGDNLNCDLTVSDIYGDYVEKIGLRKDLIAAALGKVSKFSPIT